MRLSGSLRMAIIAATSVLVSAGAQAGPMPTHVAAIKSMVDQTTTEVRWGGGGGWRGGGVGYRGAGFRGGGYGYRGGGYAYRGGYGYRGGYAYRGLGYGVAAGAIVGGAIARRGYYGGYYGGGYYGGDYGGYPAYGYSDVQEYGYGGGYGGICPPNGGYAAARYYSW